MANDDLDIFRITRIILYFYVRFHMKLLRSAAGSVGMTCAIRDESLRTTFEENCLGMKSMARI